MTCWALMCYDGVEGAAALIKAKSPVLVKYMYVFAQSNVVVLCLDSTAGVGDSIIID